MPADESFASSAIKMISSFMNRELLVSRPGISEPDSDFLWASTFRAPMGISFADDSIYLNLFMPEDSDLDGERKLFLKRVNAKLQDDLWQVRRNLKDAVGNYGNALRIMMENFSTVMLDYSYIEKGRAYTHFIFNEMDLPLISSGLLALPPSNEDLRVELLRSTNRKCRLFRPPDNVGTASSVTITITRGDMENGEDDEAEGMFFTMGSLVDSGVKMVGKKAGSDLPELLMPTGAAREVGEVVAFRSRNPFLVSFVEAVAREYLVIHGCFGSATPSRINLTINVPPQQVSTLLSTLRRLAGESRECRISLVEVTPSDEE